MHFRSHTFKMGSMILLVLIYFFVELVVGHILKSVTLVADSFHMLSDFIALSIGILARRIGKWPKSSRNTFGWQRAEVVGTLTNTVMLTTLTFTILIKAIQRFIEEEAIEQPKLLFYVGVGGLAVNVIGLIILGGNHGHSHGPEIAVEMDESTDNHINLIEDGGEVRKPLTSGDDLEMDGVAIIDANDQNDVEGNKKISEVSNTKDDHAHGHGHGHSHGSKKAEAAHMNIRAVFLHVLADFMGSVAVVTSALVLWLVPGNGKWKNYVDPSISLVIVILILSSTIPLLKKSALILLQSVPKDVSIHDLKKQMEAIEGIDRVHDLHVWLLQSDVIIGTVHIKCAKEDYVEASKKVKELFHNKKIHCTTIQAEFDEHGMENINNNEDSSDGNGCKLFCSPSNASGIPGTGGGCNAMLGCCPTKETTSTTANHSASSPALLPQSNFQDNNTITTTNMSRPSITNTTTTADNL